MLDDSFDDALGVAKVHPITQATADAAELTTDHGRFREMRDAIFADQQRLCVPLRAMLADTLGLSRWNAWGMGKAPADFVGGRYSGVEGTPSIFINGHRHLRGLTLNASIAPPMASAVSRRGPRPRRRYVNADFPFSDETWRGHPKVSAPAPDRPFDPR